MKEGLRGQQGPDDRVLWTTSEGLEKSRSVRTWRMLITLSLRTGPSAGRSCEMGQDKTFFGAVRAQAMRACPEIRLREEGKGQRRNPQKLGTDWR